MLSRKQNWNSYWTIHIPRSKFIYNRNHFPNESLYNPSTQSCIMERWFIVPFLLLSLLTPSYCHAPQIYAGTRRTRRSWDKAKDMARVPQWWSIAWNRSTVYWNTITNRATKKPGAGIPISTLPDDIVPLNDYDYA